MGRTDDLDRMLMRLPSEASPENLPGRVTRYVKRKQLRRYQVRLVLDLFLIVSGLWLCSPLISSLFTTTDLSKSALGTLFEWIQVALAGIGTYLNYAWSGFSGMQSNLAAPMDVSILLGMAALTLGVLLGLGQLLPRSASRMAKGIQV